MATKSGRQCSEIVAEQRLASALGRGRGRGAPRATTTRQTNRTGQRHRNQLPMRKTTNLTDKPDDSCRTEMNQQDHAQDHSSALAGGRARQTHPHHTNGSCHYCTTRGGCFVIWLGWVSGLQRTGQLDR